MQKLETNVCRIMQKCVQLTLFDHSFTHTHFFAAICYYTVLIFMIFMFIRFNILKMPLHQHAQHVINNPKQAYK